MNIKNIGTVSGKYTDGNRKRNLCMWMFLIIGRFAYLLGQPNIPAWRFSPAVSDGLTLILSYSDDIIQCKEQVTQIGIQFLRRFECVFQMGVYRVLKVVKI